MTRVYVVAPFNPTSEDDNPINNTTFQDSRKGMINWQRARATFKCRIERDKEESILRSERRMQMFEDILKNSTLKYGSWKGIFKWLYVILVSLVPISIFTMIPAHNLIKNPGYWYEFILQVCFAFLPTFAAAWTESFYFCTNIKFLRTPRFFIELWIILVLSTLLTIAAVNLLWLYGLRYQIPVPFTFYILYLNAIIVTPITIWYRLPMEWHQSSKFKKRLRYFVAGSLYMTCTTLAYAAINKILLFIPLEYQWIAVIFLPLVRELHLLATININAKCVDGDYDAMVIFRTQSVTIGHSIFLANTVGNIVTNTNSYVIMAIDFLLNMFICCKIIYLKYKDDTPANKVKTIQLLQELMIYEWIEVVIPMAYLVFLMMAYYGPNKELIGDIGSSYWQYAAIENINEPIMYLCIFFVVDLVSLFVTGYVLWFFCQINVYKAYAALQDEFGWAFAVLLTANLIGVNN